MLLLLGAISHPFLWMAFLFGHARRGGQLVARPVEDPRFERATHRDLAADGAFHFARLSFEDRDGNNIGLLNLIRFHPLAEMVEGSLNVGVVDCHASEFAHGAPEKMEAESVPLAEATILVAFF